MSEQLTFPGYVEAYVIVEGVVEDEQTFNYGEGRLLDDWLKTAKYTAMSSPVKTEIFLLHHDHDFSVEDCVCGQYLTDHHPFWEWPPQKRGDS